jgi:hypothetical protein
VLLILPIFRVSSQSAPTAPVGNKVLHAPFWKQHVLAPSTFLPVSVGSGHKRVTLVDALTIAANLVKSYSVRRSK